jgi:hypothetical protein
MVAAPLAGMGGVLALWNQACSLSSAVGAQGRVPDPKLPVYLQGICRVDTTNNRHNFIR